MGVQENELRQRISDILDKPEEKPDDKPGENQDDDKTKPAARKANEKPADEDPTGEAGQGDQEEEETLGLSDDEVEQLGEDPEGDDDPGEDQDQDENEEAPLDAKALAEKLDISIEDLYATEFNYADGESLTLGQLKDAGDRARTLDDEAEMLSQDRDRLDNDNMTARAEMQNIVSLLPVEALDPRLLAQAKQQHDELVRSERISLMTAIPGWKDPSAELEARASILENLTEYGFREIEVNNMLDHRLIKLIHDYTRLRQKLKPKVDEIKRLKRKPGSRKPAARQKSQKRDQAKFDKAKRIGQSGNSRGAINALFED